MLHYIHLTITLEGVNMAGGNGKQRKKPMKKKKKPGLKKKSYGK